MPRPFVIYPREENAVNLPVTTGYYVQEENAHAALFKARTLFAISGQFWVTPISTATPRKFNVREVEGGITITTINDSNPDTPWPSSAAPSDPATQEGYEWVKGAVLYFVYGRSTTIDNTLDEGYLLWEVSSDKAIGRAATLFDLLGDYNIAAARAYPSKANVPPTDAIRITSPDMWTEDL